MSGGGDRFAGVRTTAAAVGCLLLLGDPGIARADVRVGPGPVNPYSVQPQPAPGSCHYRQAADGATLPDPVCTPGATNPQVSAETLYSTVCQKGYSASIRPPRDITDAEKRANAAAYGYNGPLGHAEYDHLISLALGGDPNDPRNLWVEPQASPNTKDDIEFRLIQLVCQRRVPLADAPAAIAADWTTAVAAVTGR
jgi:hypothetical protein